MNNFFDVKIFSSVYVDRLYRNLVQTQDFSLYKEPIFRYENNFAKGHTGIVIDKDFNLDPEQDDFYNSIKLYEALKNINEIQASDERLWSYFTHVLCWEYMRARWPAEEAKEPVNRIRDRYFLRTSTLQTLSRNGISRLWWYAHLTYDPNRKNKYELTEILLKRADLTVGIVERALGSNKNIRTAILEFLNSNPDILNSEERSRKLLLNLQLAGGVKNLPLLNVDDLKLVLNQL